MKPDEYCERCYLEGDGRITKPIIVLKQKDDKIAYNAIIGLCAKHYIGLEKVYKDLGWSRYEVDSSR